MELLAGDNDSIVLVDDIFSFTVGFESMVTGREIKPSTVCLIAEHSSPELSKFQITQASPMSTGSGKVIKNKEGLGTLIM